MDYTKKRQVTTYAVIGAVIAVSAVSGFVGYTLLQSNKTQNVTQVSSFSSVVSTLSTVSSSSITTVSNSSFSSTASVSLQYKSGTYSINKSYSVPRSTTSVTFKVIVENDFIKWVETTKNSGDSTSLIYIDVFNKNISDEVGSKKLSDIDSVFVSGASLTSKAFTSIISQIKTDASK